MKEKKKLGVQELSQIKKSAKLLCTRLPFNGLRKREDRLMQIFFLVRIQVNLTSAYTVKEEE